MTLVPQLCRRREYLPHWHVQSVLLGDLHVDKSDEFDIIPCQRYLEIDPCFRTRRVTVSLKMKKNEGICDRYGEREREREKIFFRKTDKSNWTSPLTK